ncbi:MAG: hypothetical protein IKV36_02990, partial [Clostridia bacterium]|nr:hypothetical protein [Clostridia bacterium]
MKKVLCMLLCLCMMISILPTALVINAEAASKEMTFNYGYDVQRNPAFPAKAGDKVTLSGFQTPLRYGSTAYGSMRRYENSKGTWTLTEVGTYGSIGSISPAPTTFLKSIVKTVAENCGISDMNSIVIHKLTGNNNNLVGYGVVLCIDEDAGQALFLVDLFNDSGAGMLLSKTEVTSKSVTITADKIAQSGTGAKENESISIPSDAKMVETLNFTMTEPYAWEKPAKTATVKQSDLVEVVDVKWNGAMWNADGTFMQGASYSVDITIRLKSGVNMYFDKKAYNFTINDAHGIGFAEISNDKRQAVIRKDYTFLKSKDEEALYKKEEQERLEERENSRKGTPVDKLEPGDSGSFKFTGSVYFLDYPKDYTDPKIGSSTAIAGYYD